jgi:hypothetical protein
MGGAAKNVIAGLVVLFLLDPSAGSFPWLHFKRAMLKKEIAKQITQGIEKNRLVELRFSKEEAEKLLRWEHSGEFEYKGQMYDVVQAWAVGDTLYFRCYRDREETTLNSRLKELASRALEGRSKATCQSDPGSASAKVLFPAATDKEIISTPGFSLHRVRAFANAYPSIVIPPPTPPPRRV